MNHHGNLTATFETVEHQMTEDYEQDLETNMETEPQETEPQQPHYNFPSHLKSTIATWIFKLKESCKLPQSTMEKVMEGVTDLNQYWQMQRKR